MTSIILHMSFTCQTCQTLEDDLGKHLLQSRHRAVRYNPYEELIECEDCGDSNVLLLLVLRYELSDMALLCQPCYSKLDLKALAEYSLSNGSLFSKLPQYYKFRDIQCEKCCGDSNLFVSIGRPQLVLCKNCIEEANHSKSKFVSERDDNFLYALLGIKEYVPKTGKNGKGRTRKVGRKGGRNPKKPDPLADQRRAHYESKKALEATYKAGKTVKAIGSAGHTPNISRASTPAPEKVQKKQFDSERLKNTSKNLPPRSLSKGKAFKGGVNGSRNGKEPVNPPPDGTKFSLDGEKTSLKSSGKKHGNESQNHASSKTASPVPKSVVKLQKPLKSEKLKVKAAESSESTTRLIEPEKHPKLEKSDLKPHKGKIEKAKSTSVKIEKAQNKQSRDATSTQDTKSGKANPVKSKSLEKVQPLKPLPPSNAVSDVPKKPLPPGISQYEPSQEPKLTYDSLPEYFREMCYNLFLEEKASMHTSGNSMLAPGEFELEWYADQDKKHKQYKMNVLLTDEILNRFVSKKMQAIKKTPFAVNQALILVLNGTISWYGNIAFAEAKSPSSSKGSKSRKPKRFSKPSGPKLLEVVVELFSWNDMPLPLAVSVDSLRVLPVTIPVSRVFTAMSRILNPRFIDMILGKSPIKQIVFKNFLRFTKDTFNESQKVAIQSVLNNSITVLQGPPGTGKTSTIYELILQLLDNLNVFPILVVAASNIAIDNIAEKLLPKHGKSILRIVSNEKEPEYNREHPLASICLHHKVFDGLPAHLQDTIREMRRPGSTISQNQYKKLMTEQIDYQQKLIGLARVIFTTTVVAGGNQLKSVPKLPVVIMDEATQSSEATTLIPLLMTGVNKFVFVGDQRQLSSFSQVPNLSLSLFERIILNGTYKTPHMLDTQYRMHPAISEFPRLKFYDGLLKDGITAQDRAKEGIPKNPVVFWDTEGTAREGTVRTRFKEDNGLTYANKGEVAYIEKVLTALVFEKRVPKSEIGVITPYRGQRDLISSTLQKNDLINPSKEEVHVEVDRDDFFNESKPITIHTVSDIMIASVDAFQGREKDFLVMSCVRSNENNKIGFLSDARRMNVALTRARYGLILIGDVECLSKSDALWREYIGTLQQKNSILRSLSFTYN